ncbi:FxsB family cyclophane-forming radical SAM/SPASM peptide maturase [Streptomyces echinatus]|uniref:FxsB family cyclophane-forming radical SAM/SPASM peptide maturase n=1 Tax=Streptomyces echinatus TaxID=67293 RepID=UPI0037AC31FA
MIELPLLTGPTGSGEWPDQATVARALADPEWSPVPFTEYILKIHSRCNLACDYCYMYEMADQSWRTMPQVMSRSVIDQVALRLAEHARAHAAELPDVHVKFHGGEALLAGAERIGYAARALRSALPATTDLTLSVTTNGVLLDDEALLDVLGEHGIRVAVSLDGGREAHDRHRRYAGGKGSFDRVMRGIEALRGSRHGGLLGLVLCTVDVRNEPLGVYEALLDAGAPAVDFELPLGNRSQPPPGWSAGRTPYADWLIPVFDRWYATSPPPTTVRLFDNIIGLVLGGHSDTEGVGMGSFRTLTIDTDGSLELVDTLRSAFSGAAATGFDVFRSAFDEARLHPGVVARQIGRAGLSATCNSCPLLRICGGGEYAHRYQEGSGFLHPSVYCADLSRLIRHIRDRVLADVAALTR